MGSKPLNGHRFYCFALQVCPGLEFHGGLQAGRSQELKKHAPALRQACAFFQGLGHGSFCPHPGAKHLRQQRTLLRAAAPHLQAPSSIHVFEALFFIIKGSVHSSHRTTCHRMIIDFLLGDFFGELGLFRKEGQPGHSLGFIGDHEVSEDQPKFHRAVPGS